MQKKLTSRMIFFSKNVCVSEKQWLEIGWKSHGQSQSSTRHRERFIRINASSRAHQIKTRTNNFEGLAQRFLNQRTTNFSSVTISYGLETEKEARLSFQNIADLVMEEMGLIISFKQPWLACSPDGIVKNDQGFELLEIKCPNSCKDGAIVNREEKIVFVPYLEIMQMVM